MKDHVVIITSYNQYPVPYAQSMPYSKCIKNERLPDASGWNSDEVMQVCGPTWCRDALELFISRSDEYAIEESKR